MAGRRNKYMNETPKLRKDNKNHLQTEENFANRRKWIYACVKTTDMIRK